MNPSKLLVIFDFDGVICDSKQAYAAQMKKTVEVLSQNSFSEETYKKRVGNTDQREDFIEFLATEDEDTIEEAMNIYSDLTPEFSYLRSLFPSVKKIIEEIKTENFTCIVSRKSQSRMENWLQHFKITGLFDFAIGTVEKTKANAINRLVKRFNMPKNLTIMVGDTEFDIKSAHEAEVISVAALYDCSHKDKILEQKPDFTINSFEELKEIIKKVKEQNTPQI